MSRHDSQPPMPDFPREVRPCESFERSCEARVFWSPEDGEYVATRDDLPSLSWLAPTRAGALDGLARLVEDIEPSIPPNIELGGRGD